MLRNKGLLVTMALVCVLALTLAVFAQAPGRRGRQGQRQDGQGLGAALGMRGPVCPARLFMPPPPEAMDRIAQELALTADQKAQATELLKGLQAKVQQVIAKGQPVPDLVQELKSASTDAGKLQALGATVIAREGEILQAELDMWVNFKKLLTPEQQTKLWDLVLRRAGPPAPGGAPPPPQQ